MTVSYDISRADAKRVQAIVARAAASNATLDQAATIIDLAMCSANGTPLDFAKLEASDDFAFFHDVYGIQNHLDRATGQLRGEFVPRCAR